MHKTRKWFRLSEQALTALEAYAKAHSLNTTESLERILSGLLSPEANKVESSSSLSDQYLRYQSDVTTLCIADHVSMKERNKQAETEARDAQRLKTLATALKLKVEAEREIAFIHGRRPSTLAPEGDIAYMQGICPKGRKPNACLHDYNCERRAQCYQEKILNRITYDERQ